MVVRVHYALLSRNRLSGFHDIRAAVTWISGPTALLESTDSLSIRRGDGGDIMLRAIDLRQGDTSAQYAAALLLRFDLEKLESAALAWEVLLAVFGGNDL